MSGSHTAGSQSGQDQLVADLVRMANQIARNFGALPPDRVPVAIAKHLNDFWAPSMRLALAERVRQGGEGLEGSVVAAAGLLQLPAC